MTTTRERIAALEREKAKFQILIEKGNAGPRDKALEKLADYDRMIADAMGVPLEMLERMRSR